MTTQPLNGTAKWQVAFSAAALAVALIGAVITLYIKVNSNEQALNEIETQFCAADIIRNDEQINNLRRFSELYQKVHGEPYPVVGFYAPSICNRETQ